MRVWKSDDCLNWKLQAEALFGSHGDVVVSGDRAWWFYFGGRGPRVARARGAGSRAGALPPSMWWSFPCLTANSSPAIPTSRPTSISSRFARREIRKGVRRIFSLARQKMRLTPFLPEGTPGNRRNWRVANPPQAASLPHNSFRPPGRRSNTTKPRSRRSAPLGGMDLSSGNHAHGVAREKRRRHFACVRVVSGLGRFRAETRFADGGGERNGLQLFDDHGRHVSRNRRVPPFWLAPNGGRSIRLKRCPVHRQAFCSIP